MGAGAMAVGDREFGALLERVDGLTQALHEALPALQRQDTCRLTCGQLERRITELEAAAGRRSAARWQTVAALVTGLLALIGVIAQAALK